MSDYDDWLKKHEAEQARAAVEDDGDIRDEDAFTQRHTWRDAEGKEHIPIWAITSGGWASLLLLAGYQALATLLIYSDAGPRDPQAKALLWMAAFVPSFILAFLTWRLIGRRARGVLRAFVWVLPVLLVGWVIFSALTTPPKTARVAVTPPPPPVAAAVAAPAQPAVVPVPAAPLGATTVIHWEPLLGGPPAVVAGLQHALSSGDEQGQGAALAMLAEARRVCVARAREGLRIPSTSLEPHLQCARAVRSLEPMLAKLAPGVEEKLLKSASGGGPWRVEAGLFGLGFASPSEPVLGALFAALPTSEVALEALSTLGRREPSPVLKRAEQEPANEAPLARLHRQWLTARLAPKPEAACAQLGELALSNGLEDQRGALRALDELSPRCQSLTPRLLAAKGNFHADNAVGAMPLSQFAQVRQELEARGPGGGSTLANSLEKLVDNDWLEKVGMTPLVFDHPTALGTLAKPVVERGPCPPGRLGATAAALKTWSWVPVCALKVTPAEWSGPLVPW